MSATGPPLASGPRAPAQAQAEYGMVDRYSYECESTEQVPMANAASMPIGIHW
jgi:hypothetical protein